MIHGFNYDRVRLRMLLRELKKTKRFKRPRPEDVNPYDSKGRKRFLTNRRD